MALSEQEKLFCELYTNGSVTYAGNAARCYSEVFDDDSLTAKNSAQQLLAKPEVQQYLQELDELSYEEAKYMKKYLTTNLMGIIDEASTAQYIDRFGTPLSPAPLRSVAVSASKALMEMYPVKESHKLELNAEEGGITLNIVVPDKPKTLDE